MSNREPQVPDGWKAQYDEKYQTWFYVNLKTGKSQWEAPEGTTFKDKEEAKAQPPPYAPDGHQDRPNSSQSGSIPPQNSNQRFAGRGQGFPQQQYYPQQPQGFGGPQPGFGGGYPPQGMS
ncbi:hypothetical protein BN7_3469 [Wickerhamomyces ciferrii]|uniref:WW domain-containing protein n=1 Tax=Wickerhamomyces ciferrii (strain ATCC 14091 / BCRC 22168 / CBS 111 / JCM 3599 / NBRC 0793 / NRRL Y-1031 F-60-10) TaxID=1206466 RepID=K0KRJ1_WICCF|nr:uncharacterized protein BN7_3469 [Wickerhamomyces ciferrii]CCH43914.1 hypothetical protein BN7_3469 [Wickerhamomyces ciferrii]